MSATYLSFYIGNELFALRTDKVLEVLNYQGQTITRIPNSSDFLNGLLNFRGEGIPVFDTRVQFNLGNREFSKKTFILVVDLQFESEMIRAGAVVDKVQNVFTIHENDIQSVPPMQRHFNIEFLEGVVKQGDEFILLLNMEKVFTHDQSEYLKQVKITE